MSYDSSILSFENTSNNIKHAIVKQYFGTCSMAPRQFFYFNLYF